MNKGKKQTKNMQKILLLSSFFIVKLSLQLMFKLDTRRQQQKKKEI